MMSNYCVVFGAAVDGRTAYTIILNIPDQEPYEVRIINAVDDMLQHYDHVVKMYHNYDGINSQLHIEEVLR